MEPNDCGTCRKKTHRRAGLTQPVPKPQSQTMGSGDFRAGEVPRQAAAPVAPKQSAAVSSEAGGRLALQALTPKRSSP